MWHSIHLLCHINYFLWHNFDFLYHNCDLICQPWYAGITWCCCSSWWHRCDDVTWRVSTHEYLVHVVIYGIMSVFTCYKKTLI